MMVDDSAVIRGLFQRVLSADPSIEIVASVANGKHALDALDRNDVEVIVLDIEMPVMDGITALPQILRKKPNVKVVMASTLTTKNAAISMKALSLGASDYIGKPSATGLNAAADFKRELVEKIKVLGAVARGKRGLPLQQAALAPSARETGLYPGKPVVLRPMPTERPAALAIGSSTGGPQALSNLFEALGNRLRVPIFITQHMPPTFTTILAERLGAISGLPAGEGKDGEMVVPGRIYVAPGGMHMLVKKDGGKITTHLSNAPPENFCRPAVDPMLRSLSQVYGSKLFVLIMTGMGSDGAKGAEIVVQARGAIIAQDEPTSVVWGMPGAVATAGLCSAVLRISDIAPLILKTFGVGK